MEAVAINRDRISGNNNDTIDLKEAALLLEKGLITKEELSILAAIAVNKMLEDNDVLGYELNQLNNILFETWQMIHTKEKK